MPMHDWTRVEGGIYHDFHHECISAIKRALNRGLLPSDHDALAEQVAAGFGPDVLPLQGDTDSDNADTGGTATRTQARPRTAHTARVIGGLTRRFKSQIAVRHVTDDRVVAILEIVSPGNKSSAHALCSFVNKAAERLEQRVHLLLIDPLPPGPRDPNGIHAAIWDNIAQEPFTLPLDRPLTLAAYEAGNDLNAFVETIAVGEALPDLPLFLAPGWHVTIPLECIYQAAWETVPRRWQAVIAPPE
jgi:hypothetical protein